ncbi:chitin synthase regulatory factor chr2 [Pelomyxa schiedti]|nr:chitin synthase regulatory factor chr2 [Pelomyxa schiedti]
MGILVFCWFVEDILFRPRCWSSPNVGWTMCTKGCHTSNRCGNSQLVGFIFINSGTMLRLWIWWGSSGHQKSSVTLQDGWALYNLGSCYECGRGVDQDFGQAVTLYQRAADAGNAAAICKIGCCYQEGTGVDRDISKAVALYQRAADAGMATAMCNLGVCYETGNGIYSDSSMAAALYHRAADAGNPLARSHLSESFSLNQREHTDELTLYQQPSDREGTAFPFSRLLFPPPFIPRPESPRWVTNQS